MNNFIHSHQSIRPSRYVQLTGTAVAQLDQARLERQSLVLDETSAEGKRRLLIQFPTPRGREPIQILNVTNWLSAPELAVPFAEMVVAWGGDKSEMSRQSFINDMNNGFFQYLTDCVQQPPNLSRLDTTFINGFIQWLSRIEDGAFVFAAYTRLHYLGVLRSIVSHLKKSQQYAELISKDLHVRRNPWPGVSRQIQHPTKILPRPVWEKLYNACRNECRETMQRLDHGWQLLENEADDANLLASKLKRLDQLFPDIIPTFLRIQRLDARLARDIGNRESLAKLKSYFQPSPRDLVPFVLLLGMVSHYSGETLLATVRDDLTHTDAVGGKRLIWRPYKTRSRRRQYRSFALSQATESPNVLIPFIELWTGRIRTVASPRLQNRLFIWVPVTKSSEPHAFESKSGATKGAWEDHLDAFLAQHGLPHLTLRQVRATGIDNVHALFSGDLRALQAASGHQNPEVILSHYTSDTARQRNDELLGNIMSLRTRWRETDGVIDPRDQPSGQDLAAATPGWRCLDPYDSPIVGQDKGKLCSAYGACPACPLSHVNLQDAYSFARVLQLKVKIEQAQEQMPASRWLLVWAPRLYLLNMHWLPRFRSEKLLEEAAKLDLNDLPDLE
jgi:hypothetical protein